MNLFKYSLKSIAPKPTPRLSTKAVSAYKPTKNVIVPVRKFAASTAVTPRRNREIWSDLDALDMMPFITPMVFEDIMRPLVTTKGEAWRPKADLIETGEEYKVHAELPGVPKDQVKVMLDKDTNVLTVKGTVGNVR